MRSNFATPPPLKPQKALGDLPTVSVTGTDKMKCTDIVDGNGKQVASIYQIKNRSFICINPQGSEFELIHRELE